MTRKLVIFHEGSGTMISLSDKVYLIDKADLTEDEVAYGRPVDPRASGGIRIDNFNMGRCFFGDES